MNEEKEIKRKSCSIFFETKKIVDIFMTGITICWLLCYKKKSPVALFLLSGGNKLILHFSALSFDMSIVVVFVLSVDLVESF